MTKAIQSHFKCRLVNAFPARAHASLLLTSCPIRIPRTGSGSCQPSPLSSGRTELKQILFIQKEEQQSFQSSISSSFYFIENEVQDNNLICDSYVLYCYKDSFAKINILLRNNMLTWPVWLSG